MGWWTILDIVKFFKCKILTWGQTAWREIMQKTSYQSLKEFVAFSLWSLSHCEKSKFPNVQINSSNCKNYTKYNHYFTSDLFNLHQSWNKLQKYLKNADLFSLCWTQLLSCHLLTYLTGQRRHRERDIDFTSLTKHFSSWNHKHNCDLQLQCNE